MNDSYYSSLLGCVAHLRQVLLASGAIPEVAERIIPVTTQSDQPLPFITYYRSGLNTSPVKNARGPVSATCRFQIYTKEWSEGISIASRLIEVLDGLQDDRIRICTLTDAADNHDPNVPAHVQIVTFEVRPR